MSSDITTRWVSDNIPMRENSRSDTLSPCPKTLWGAGPIFPRFSKKDVADDCVGNLLEVARLAPSEWNLQTKRWIVVRGGAAKQYLETATCIALPLSSAPVILICLADTLAWKSAPQYFQEMIASRKITEEEGREALRRLRDHYSSSPDVAKRTALANAFLAVHQILLSASECRLSAYWVTEFDEGKIKAYFHIPEHFLVAALIPLGYHEEASPAPLSMLHLRTKIYREKFGGSQDLFQKA